MQQTPPPPPTAPPAPAPGVTAVVGADGRVTLEGIPQNPQEVQGLRARREMLRDQLNRATNRREEVASQLGMQTGDQAQTGIQLRLTQLDERIMQIERDQATTEQLLSNAPPAVLAVSQPATNYSNMVDNDEAVAWAFFAFGLGVLVAMFIGRLRRRRRARRDAGKTPLPAALGQDRRFDQLAQAVDAIADEVERIGEGQRFVTQLLAERKQAAALSDEAGRR